MGNLFSHIVSMLTSPVAQALATLDSVISLGALIKKSLEKLSGTQSVAAVQSKWSQTLRALCSCYTRVRGMVIEAGFSRAFVTLAGFLGMALGSEPDAAIAQSV